MLMKQKSFFLPPGSDTTVKLHSPPESADFILPRINLSLSLALSESALHTASTSLAEYHAISRVRIGETPSSTAESFLQSRSGESAMAFSTCSGSHSSRHSLSWRGGASYCIPGSTRRTEEISSVIRFTLSITRPSRTRIILL